jgi:nucleoside 2-deoxyribosyltransferase
LNRLKNQRAYLAGAIDRVPDRGLGWRSDITPLLGAMGVVVFNPLNKATEIGAEDEGVHELKSKLKGEFRYDELSAMMKAIRATDLRLVDISDFLVVNLDINTHPCGTLEEIFWANRQKKPIIVRIEQGKSHAPDWLFGTIPHEMIFSTWKEVMEYLVHVDSAEVVDTKSRWYFFSV